MLGAGIELFMIKVPIFGNTFCNLSLTNYLLDDVARQKQKQRLEEKYAKE